MFERGLTPRQKDDLDRHITGNYGEGAFDDGEWLSECCGATPHEASPDVNEDNPTGVCGGCREHAGFENGEDENFDPMSDDLANDEWSMLGK